MPESTRLCCGLTMSVYMWMGDSVECVGIELRKITSLQDLTVFVCTQIDDSVECVGIEQRKVTSVQDLSEILSLGNRNRRIRETRFNEKSSRSHTVLQVHVKRSQHKEGVVVLCCSKLSLVDLAGSERWGTVGGADSSASVRV